MIPRRLAIWFNKLFFGKPVPKQWWTYHAQECGTRFRGCAPWCPKYKYETTGIWKMTWSKND